MHIAHLLSGQEVLVANTVVPAQYESGLGIR
jgi:hypothetical protein